MEITRKKPIILSKKRVIEKTSIGTRTKNLLNMTRINFNGKSLSLLLTQQFFIAQKIDYYLKKINTLYNIQYHKLNLFLQVNMTSFFIKR